MASTSATSVPSKPSLHPRLNPLDYLRFLLFLTIPLYVQFSIPPSLASVLGHQYMFATTGICIVHFSGGAVGLDWVRHVVCGLAMSCLPNLSQSYPFLTWIVPNIQGWRGIAVNWMFAALPLIDLLPEIYGRDVQVRSIPVGLCHFKTDMIQSKDTHQRVQSCLSFV